VAKETAADFTKAAHDAGLKIERQLARVHDKFATIRP
jgi:ribosome-associated translation inhibitor RaiA